MSSENILGERIREFRQSKGLTQPQLGEAIGLSKQAVNDIEQGRRETTITKAILLARLFNTTIEYLHGDTDNPERPDELPFIEQLFGRENRFRFVERLKSLRISKNTSPREIGEVTCLGTLRYKNIESASTGPDLETLIALADYFDVSIDYLIGRSDDPVQR